MFRRTVLSTAVAVALGSSFVSSAAYSNEDSVEKLEKIQVTGSRISRVDVEGVAPVTIISREDLDRSGATSVADVLRSLTENGGGSYNETYTNSFAPGSAFTSLRGLGSSRTLTLLNGRRVANYGFAQNVNDTGVDLNSIPLGAVERIEVLKDGASAIYGSDAIAGVINIILKDSYDGTAVTFTTGSTTKHDGQEGKINLVTGKEFGDSNVLVSFDYFNRNNINMTDRDLNDSADHSDKNGGYDFRSSLSIYPSYEIVNADGSSKDPKQNVCNDPTGNQCAYDYAGYLDLVPATERYGLLSIFSHDFNDSVSGFAELSYNHVLTDTRSAPTPDFINRVMDASNPNNPTGEAIRVKARYADVGPRLNEITNDAYRVVGGFKGGLEFADKFIDWEGAAGYSRNETVTQGKNYIHTDRFYAAVDNGSYNPLTPTQNSQEVIDTFRLSTKREALSEMTFVSGSFSMPVFSLPAGDVYMAAGVEWREESIDDKPDPNGAAGNIMGAGGTSSKGDRNSRALYSEFSVPLHDTLEMQLAGRFEKYSDFGSTLDPKIAFRWQPLDNLMFRTSYSTAFKAPTLPELYLGESISYVRVIDEAGCDANPGNPEFCNANQYKQRSSGNADLEAEEAESFNFGVVYEPVDNLELKLDIYKIRNTNVIDQLSSQDIVDTNNPALVERKDDGTIDYINNLYLNVAKQVVEGVDAEIAYSFDFGANEFGLKYKTSYLHTFERADSDGELEDVRSVSGVLSGSGPHLKSKYLATWDREDHGVTFTTNYTSSYQQPRDPSKVGGTDTSIDSHYTFDIQYVYDGFDKTKLTFGVDNLTDEEAPFSNYNSDGYDITVHDNRGRFVYGKVAYNF